MPLHGRVSARSSTSRASTCTPEVYNLTSGKLICAPTPSGNHLVVDANQLVYKTSSVALLKANARDTNMRETNVRDANVRETNMRDSNVRDSNMRDSNVRETNMRDYNMRDHNMRETNFRDSNLRDTNMRDINFVQQKPLRNALSTKALPGNLDVAQRVYGCMNHLWREQRLCDVVLQTKSRDLLAHKIVLAAYSDALSDKFAEFPQGEMINVDLTDIEAETVKTVIGFLYTSEITLTNHNVMEIQYCATEMGVMILIRTCMEYISKTMDPQNAFLFFSHAHRRNMDDIKQKVMTYISGNFGTITGRRELAMIPFDMFLLLLSSDSLGVDSELAVFRAVVRWVDANRGERLRLASALLKCVRYQLLGVTTIVTEVESVQWMFMARDCHDWLYDVMRYHALKGSGSPLISSYPVQRPRHARDVVMTSTPNAKASPVDDAQPTLRYLRMDGSPTGRVENWPGPVTYPSDQMSTPAPNRSLNTSTTPATSPDQPISTMSPISTPRAQPIRNKSPITPSTLPMSSPDTTASSPTRQPIIVAVGGIDIQSMDADIPGRYLYKYEPCMNEWQMLATMKDYVHHHVVASVDGRIYVIGGAIYDPSRPDQLGRATDAVLVYDTQSHEWSRVSHMMEARAYHGVATSRQRIFVVGGENQDKVKLDSIECYDVERDSWFYIARMVGGPKIGMAVAFLDDCLFMVGGYSKQRSGENILGDVECFDLNLERWIKKKPLSVPRCHANLVQVYGRLWLVGGRTRVHDDVNGSHLISLTSLEQYDATNDAWNHVTDLTEPRHDSGCVALGHYIHIIGGVQANSPYCMSTVECINVETGFTVSNMASLPSPAAGLACCQL